MVLGACSSDSSDPGAEGEDPAASEGATGTETGDGSTDADTSSADSSGDGGAATPGALADECEFVLEAVTGTSATVGDPDNIDPGEAGDLFRSLADVASDEISDDLITYAEFYEIVVSATSDPDNIDSDALAALSDPDYLRAAENIADYFEENCGVEG